MKILIYGHKGWIGQQMLKHLSKEQVVKGECRVNNKKLLEKEIKRVKPTHIISFIGRTHGKIGDKTYSTIDFLEQKGKIYENVRDNLFSPLVLALLCKKYNIHLTYLGTGCIFKYDQNHPYEKEENGFLETDIPNFFGSSYSVVKGFTDELMHLLDKTVLNLRIRMPISDDWSPRNFIYKITHYEKICSIKNSMTVLPEMLPLILQMMKHQRVGTFNLCNPGLISHNEILEMYKEIIDSNFTWKNFTEEEQDKILAAERSNNYLDTTKLERLYKVDNIKVAVKKIIINLKNQ